MTHDAIHGTSHGPDGDDPIPGGGGGGAPTDATYLVTTSNAELTAEVVVGLTPQGELGGTWASPTVDAIHSGSAHVLLTSNTPTAEAFGDTGVVGTGTASARDDHRHAMPSITDSTSTTSSTTAASATAVKSAYDAASAKPSLTSNTPAAETFGAVGVVGVGTAAARDDHVHGMPAITDSTATTSSTTAASATAVKSAYDLANGKVSTSTSVSTTAPLTGGGALSSSLTLAVSAATTTSTGVVELATDGESAAGVVVQGNDSRMSNSRTPTVHAIDGALHSFPGGTTTYLRADGTFTAPTAAVSATTVEVDLGSTAKWTGRFTITDAAISSSSKVMCWQAPGPYTGKGTRADEAEMQPVQVIAVNPGSGSAVVYWQTPPMITFKSIPQMGQGTTTSIPKDPQSVVRSTPTRIGKVEGNVKFTYTVMA